MLHASILRNSSASLKRIEMSTCQIAYMKRVNLITRKAMKKMYTYVLYLYRKQAPQIKSNAAHEAPIMMPITEIGNIHT